MEHALLRLSQIIDVALVKGCHFASASLFYTVAVAISRLLCDSVNVDYQLGEYHGLQGNAYC